MDRYDVADVCVSSTLLSGPFSFTRCTGQTNRLQSYVSSTGENRLELGPFAICYASGTQKENEGCIVFPNVYFFVVVRKCAHLPFKWELQTQISLEAKVVHVNFRSWCEKNGEMRVS